jgi:hypothetical protein
MTTFVFGAAFGLRPAIAVLPRISSAGSQAPRSSEDWLLLATLNGLVPDVYPEKCVPGQASRENHRSP